MYAGRKVCSAIVWLWVCFVSQCKRVLGHSPKSSSKLPSSSAGKVGTSPATGQKMEWEESWNTMEPFSVTVVPRDRDLFEDMQPVVKKTKKVYIGGRGEESESTAESHKFAVETEFRGPDSGELGEWEEEEEGGGKGWEVQTGQEEGSVLVASREAMAQQKRAEREKRRKLQEALRFSQQRKQQPSLGVRLSDSS